ncbi:substrate-binding domain-containing protein [Gluconobacter oxydans]|nr:substrate-binding domain-containing protein [Gluconobacter oxydans]MCP1250159.1 substrate-binding domain-containing protein [Gluconobacter oxydans]
MLDSIADILQAADLQIMLVKAPGDSALDEIVHDISRYRVDGVISTLPVASDDSANHLNRYQIPIVLMNSGHAGEWLRTISVDSSSGGALAANRLHALGRHRPAYLAGRSSTPQDQRQAGFVDACKSLNMDTRCHVAGFDYDDGCRATRNLFKGRRCPDALFCVNDLVACGAVDVLRHEFGLDVPNDVDVIGFDDIPMASWSSYDLTTFSQDITILVNTIMDMIERDVECHARVLPPRLIERGTTRRPVSQISVG